MKRLGRNPAAAFCLLAHNIQHRVNEFGTLSSQMLREPTCIRGRRCKGSYKARDSAHGLSVVTSLRNASAKHPRSQNQPPHLPPAATHATQCPTLGPIVASSSRDTHACYQSIHARLVRHSAWVGFWELVLFCPVCPKTKLSGRKS